VFQLSCLGKPNSVLQYNDFIGVQYINVSEGLVGIKYNSSFVEILFNMFSQFRFSSQGVVSNIFGKGPNLYVDPTESASVQWAVANLTCQQAQQNTSTYACVSTNSSCSRVISTMQGYVGYRCTCLPGYDGNPYIPDGCKDIDECLQTPRICKELCHNTEGNYSCTMCPDHTEYDVIRMQCTPRRNQSLLLGSLIIINSTLTKGCMKILQMRCYHCRYYNWPYHWIWCVDS
jgi:hypothetical protein